jgi:DNA-binding ferritin-like protein
MSSFNPESEFERTSREREPARELREVKEGEKDPELEAAARLERADYLVKEVKSSRQQMQNIVLHMQQVTTLIAQLRKQLKLAEDDGDPASVEQDKKAIEDLKKKIQEHRAEIEDMQEDLVKAQMAELQKQGVMEGVEKMAREMVERMLEGVNEA